MCVRGGDALQGSLIRQLSYQLVVREQQEEKRLRLTIRDGRTGIQPATRIALRVRASRGL